MQHHERVGIIAVRTQIVDHRLPIVGSRIRRVDKRIKLGEREQARVHVRVLQQTEQPSASGGARNQAVRRVNHADSAAGICDVNAHCHLLTIAWYLISTCLRFCDYLNYLRLYVRLPYVVACDWCRRTLDEFGWIRPDLT